MHVCLVIETGSPSPYWVSSLSLLRAAGLDVSLITTGMDDGLEPVASRIGARVEELGQTSGWQYPTTARRLRRCIERLRPDVLHVHEPIPWAIARLAFPRHHPSPLVFHRHHTRQRGAQAILSRLGSGAADRTLAVSAAAATAAVSEGVDPSRIDVVWNGVPPLRAVERQEVSVLRRRLGIPPEALTVVLVGRLRPEKGHDLALAALGILKQRLRSDIHLVFVGDGPLRGRLSRQTGGMDAVHMVGHTDDVAPWYALGDVVIVPSRLEPFGLVAIEALNAGRPLVVSATGGLTEIVRDGLDGLTFLVGDAAALADAMQRLLADRELADRLIQEGRRRYREHFTAEAMVSSWIAAYERAVRE